MLRVAWLISIITLFGCRESSRSTQPTRIPQHVTVTYTFQNNTELVVTVDGENKVSQYIKENLHDILTKYKYKFSKELGIDLDCVRFGFIQDTRHTEYALSVFFEQHTKQIIVIDFDCSPSGEELHFGRPQWVPYIRNYYTKDAPAELVTNFRLEVSSQLRLIFERIKFNSGCVLFSKSEKIVAIDKNELIIIYYDDFIIH